jgi:Na+/melibiose symporter-like transporter
MKPFPLIAMAVGTAIALGAPALTIGRHMYFRSAGIAHQTAAESQIALMTSLSMFAVLLGGLIAIGGYALHKAFSAEEKRAIERRAQQEAKRDARQAQRDARQVGREARRSRDPID